MSEHEQLLDGFRRRKRRALARAISMVEGEKPGFQPFLHELIKGGLSTGRLGVTGPPGAGKSTLVSSLAGVCRERDEEVGIVAVDPTSPFSGGALLGDRIRMHDVATDRGIFIRSMATRGSLGGLATTTKEVLDVMDSFGFGRLIVETVGVGQSELEVTGATDTVAVVLVPESGDGVQAMKAGLMEVADIFVVNKADRPGADRLVKELRTALKLRQGEGGGNVPAHHGVDMRRAAREEERGKGRDEEAHRDQRPEADHEEGGWEVPIVQTVGQTGEGVDELLDTVDRHRRHLAESGELERRRRERARTRVRDVVRRELHRAAWREMDADPELEGDLGRIVEGVETPYSVARRVVEAMGIEEAEERLPERGG